MRDRLEQLLRQADISAMDRGITDYNEAIKANANYLLANGVIVPPVRVEPIISVSKKPFHNRIEVVKNIRYEWNEARFCFSEDEANRVEAEWKALAQREGKE